ncbi:waprin-Thr1 [Bemisia tabaci]|uniref:waprin-Thr1 n=1 Tax=Bemisia tabaci TaxID=7038 RepID=UPI0008F9BBBC|nr:PREDICTED: WAP four-disulfide core domain protein 2-like [Bemisia tabaci]
MCTTCKLRPQKMSIPLKCLFGVILPIFLLVQPAFNFTSSKTGFCPLRLSVTSCAPRCMSDWECGEDRKCCPNICGSMSCAATSAVESSDKKFDSSNSGGVRCANTMCHPQQICKTDPKTKRRYCANF